MDFQLINSFLAPIGLIVAGVIIKISKNNETFGVFKKILVRLYFFRDVITNI